MKKDIKRKNNKTSKGICSKIDAANVYFIICACVLIYTTAIPVLAMILEHWGEQTEATITSNTSTLFHRWSVSCYMYEFGLNGQNYTGNSLIKEDESDSIGKKIKVYYFKKFPSFNKPLSYYDN